MHVLILLLAALSGVICHMTVQIEYLGSDSDAEHIGLYRVPSSIVELGRSQIGTLGVYVNMIDFKLVVLDGPSRVINPVKVVLKPSSVWRGEVIQTPHGNVYIKYSTSCLSNFYGPHCLVFCNPQVNTTGHYICDADGNKKGAPGFTGDNCEVAKSSSRVYRVESSAPESWAQAAASNQSQVVAAMYLSHGKDTVDWIPIGICLVIFLSAWFIAVCLFLACVLWNERNFTPFRELLVSRPLIGSAASNKDLEANSPSVTSVFKVNMEELHIPDEVVAASVACEATLAGCSKSIDV